MIDQLFSTNGVIIIVCVTTIASLFLLFLLSFRYPTINVGAGSYKLSLERKAETAVRPVDSASSSAVALPPPTEGGTRTADQVEASDTHWYVELRDAVRNQDRNKIEKIFAKLKENPPFGESPSEIEVWKYTELLRAGFDDALKALEQIETEQISESYASRGLARYYLNIKSPIHAKLHVEKMLARAQSDEERQQALSLKSECIEEEENAAAAIEFIKHELEKQYSDRVRSELYALLGKLYSGENNNEYAVAAYERSLTHDVRNKDARFQLAYIYSRITALKKLSIRHYRILLTQDRGQSLAQNNLGVEYESWSLHTKKISAWKEAREKGEGYSLGNLALAYLENGFLEEAQELLDKEDRSWIKSAERVVFAQQRIHSTVKEEQKKLDGIVESAEALWDELHKIPVSFLREPFSGTGNWIEVGGASSLIISNSGQVLKIEVKSGNSTWTGYTSKISGYTIFDVRKEVKDTSLAVSMLSSRDPAGQLLLIPQDKILHIIHLEDGSLISRWSFSQAPQS